MGKLNNRSPSIGRCKKAESASYNGALCFSISSEAQRAAHQVWGEQKPRQIHWFHAGSEGFGSHDHGGDSGYFQQTGNVSHGHVTDRSDRNQQSGIDILGFQKIDPLWAGMV